MGNKSFTAIEFALGKKMVIWSQRVGQCPSSGQTSWQCIGDEKKNKFLFCFAIIDIIFVWNYQDFVIFG